MPVALLATQRRCRSRLPFPTTGFTMDEQVLGWWRLGLGGDDWGGETWRGLGERDTGGDWVRRLGREHGGWARVSRGLLYVDAVKK
jgi:hypothetical protein